MMKSCRWLRLVPAPLQAALLLLAFAVLLAPGAALAQEGMLVDFSKAFSPDTIGPGSASTLVFIIENNLGTPVTDLAFTDNLPAGVTIADPASPSTTCGITSTLTAPDGGSTITFSGGQVAAFTTCTVQVNVTSSTLGIHTNTSGDLTSSDGNSGPATADLTVTASRPGFTKAFSPSTVGLGGRSILTFTVDNSANGGLATGLSFSDTLPIGLEIADPANFSNDCNGTATASPGGTTISLLGGFVLANSSCTITVDVIGIGAGDQDNVSSDLLFSPGGPQVPAGKATDTLTVNRDSLAFSKAFTDDPVAPGSTVTLEFFILNADRRDGATNIAFTDDLDATLSGLVATGLPMNNVCGAGSVLSGTSVISLAGGNLPAGGSCTFSVTLQVPAGATPGAYPNTTSSITADRGGSPVVGSPATETLFVQEVPVLTKTFLTDPVGAGGTTTMEFTITNQSSSSSATDIAFQDNISAFLSSAMVTSLPGPGFCGAGSFASVISVLGESVLNVSGGNLPPSGSCTFSVDLMISEGTPGGTYDNVTSSITATVNGETVTGQPASDTLTVLAAPRIDKSFTDDPVAPGDTVTLEFTISYDEFASADATGITFTDDLNAVVAGLAAVGLPANDVCGTGSQISGTTNLTFTGGTLAPGDTCTFPVTLQVPAAAVPGTFTNTTSNVVATVSGETVTGNFATDDLQISGLTFSKTFTDDPTVPGDTVNLQFTIENTSVVDATGIFFTDNLSAGLSGLAAEAPLPMNPCGAGSTISGTTTLIFTGGNLTAGTSCTFDVTVRVPAAAPDGTYGNVTSNLTATVGGSAATIPPAADSLTVSSEVILFSKSFTDDPVSPGGTVTLEFTLTNMDATAALTGITFTDDLDAALSGLQSISAPQMDVCGAGSSISGAGLLTFIGGSLPAGGSCTFSVTVMVPMGVSLGTTAVNVTSDVAGNLNGLPVTGSPASDNLVIEFLAFSKAFDGPTTATGTVVLTFTIENLSATSTVGQISFTDDLGAVLAGLVATGLPQADVCGMGSQISGTSLLAFSNGELLPGGSCTIMVTLQVPAGAAPGTYPNTTSNLLLAGLAGAGPATADLGIEPPPAFAKVFAPDATGVGLPSTLTFTIDNTASALAASALDFTDNLPAGVLVANPANTSTTCTGGTVTAVPATGVISYTGGTVAAGASCTVQADVTTATGGVFVNTTGDLTSSSGNSGTATDTLTSNPAPGFAKAFAPAQIMAGGVSTLTFTVDNSASTVAAMALDFTDNLPAGVVVATPANASTTCTGGTLTATAGTGTVSYTGGTVAAGASCTVQADVTATAPGTYDNTSGDLTSSLGNSGPAMDTLTVPPPPVFTKAFAPDLIPAGSVSTLIFTLDNTGSTLAATALDFTDGLPAGVEVAPAPNASTTCTGGTLTAVAGSGTISYTGGTVAAGASCTVQADVTAPASGSFVNTSGDLTSSLGNSGPATDTLDVEDVTKSLVKTFQVNPVLPGGTVELEYTITNASSSFPVTDLSFTEDLDAVVSGLVATGFSPLQGGDPCGSGSTFTGTSVLTLSGGNLPPSGSCTFSAVLQVPASAAPGTYPSTSSVLTGASSGAPVSGNAASADLVVEFFTFTKVFDPEAVAGGQFVDLGFTITNPDPVNGATDITFSDDLNAVIVGLAAVGLPMADVCGAGSQIDGTSVLLLTGGSLPPSGSCSFTVTLEVPANALGGTVTNVTSPLEATVGGLTVLGDGASAASADLMVTGNAVAIPTLSTWSLLFLAALLALTAVFRLRRRSTLFD